MVVIVVVMSVIVGVFYRNVFYTMISTGNGPHPELFTITQASAFSSTGTFDPNSIQPTGNPPGFSSVNNVCTSASRLTPR